MQKKPGSESENADDEIQLAANEPQSADKTTENETTKEMSDLKRLKINHAIYFIMLAYYVPITLSAIHSLSCTSYFGKVSLFVCFVIVFMRISIYCTSYAHHLPGDDLIVQHRHFE